MNNTKNPFSPEERLYALYGTNPPVQVLGRFVAERNLLRGAFYDDLQLISHLRECARIQGADISIGCNFGASFLAWLYGCTDVNPLPPHMLCSKCKRTIFSYEGDGWDLPALECCGEPLSWTGSEIPLESLTPRIENPDSQLQIYLPQLFSEQAVEIIREHYREQKYDLIPYSLDSLESADLCFVLVPKNKSLTDIADDGLWHTDMEELFAYKYRIIKLIYDARKEQLLEYHKRVALKPHISDLLTESVLATTEEKIKAKIQEEGGTLLESDELKFSSLLNVYGYLYSSHTEDNPVYLQEGAHFSDVFCYREQVWNLVQSKMNEEYRLSSELPLFITKRVRRGMFTRNRMDPETERVLRSLEISDHWIDQMKYTGYLPCKADLIRGLLDELKLTWYEQHDKSVHHRDGRFMLYNGELRPSDSYLAVRTLPEFSPDDWHNSAYDVNDDEEILHMKRVCKQCGKEFTLWEAAKEFDSSGKFPHYTHQFVGDLCADCAITEAKSLLAE